MTFEKLWYLQRAHAERYVISKNSSKVSLMVEQLMEAVQQKYMLDEHQLIFNRHKIKEYLPKLLKEDARNYTNATEFIERNKYFFETPDRQSILDSKPSVSLNQVPRGVRNLPSSEGLASAVSFLQHITEEDWSANTIRICINSIVETKTEESLDEVSRYSKLDEKLTKRQATDAWSRLIYRYLRWALNASRPGPSDASLMEIIGREETLKRLATLAEVHASSASDEVEQDDVDDSTSED